MRRFLRSGLAGVLAGVMVVTLGAMAGCGEDSDEPSGSIDLRMTVWTANRDHLELLNGIASRYRATHPRVSRISFDPIPQDSYATSLTTQIAGGKPPDLAWLSETIIADFLAGGALFPLEATFRATQGYDFGDLAPAALRSWQSGGILYAYPFSSSPFGIFVNTDLFRAADRPLPSELIKKNMWTWSMARAEAAAVSARTGRTGLVVRDFDFANWDVLSTIWQGWGAAPWGEDGRTCGFTSPAMIDAMTFIHEGIFRDKAFPGPGTAPDFFSGSAAMTIAQISRASLLPESGFHWDVVPLPNGPVGQYFTIGQGAMGVIRRSAHPREAAEFLAYLTNSENSRKLARFFPPPRRSLLTADVLAAANPRLSKEQLQAVVVDGITRGTTRATHTRGVELNQRVRAALDPMWRPGADVRGVLQDVCTAIDPLLAA